MNKYTTNKKPQSEQTPEYFLMSKTAVFEHDQNESSDTSNCVSNRSRVTGYESSSRNQNYKSELAIKKLILLLEILNSLYNTSGLINKQNQYMKEYNADNAEKTHYYGFTPKVFYDEKDSVNAQLLIENKQALKDINKELKELKDLNKKLEEEMNALKK